MSSPRTNAVVRNSSKSTKPVSPWSRAIQANAEWQDKVSDTWIECNGSYYQVVHHLTVCVVVFCPFFLISGWVFGCSLLVSTSIRHHYWHFLGHFSVEGTHCTCIVSIRLTFVNYSHYEQFNSINTWLIWYYLNSFADLQQSTPASFTFTV